MIGLHGPVVIRRARYRCGTSGKMVCPLDSILDLPSGAVTVSLARRALRLATFTSFGPLQEELWVHHRVRLSDSALDMLMHTAGGVARALARRRADLPPTARRARALAAPAIVRARAVASSRACGPLLPVPRGLDVLHDCVFSGI